MKNEILKEKFISKYSNVKSFNPTEVSLLEELARMKSGEYKSVITGCRDAFSDNPLTY